MRSLLSILTVLFCLTTVEALAVSGSRLDSLVDEYYAAQNLWGHILGQGPRPLPPDDYPPGAPPPPNSPNPPNSPPHRPPNCPPSDGPGFPGACVEAVCKQLSRFECDDRDDMYEVTRACRNVSGSCVTSLCSRMSSLACNEKVEVFEVAALCRGVVDISCVDYVCSRLPRYHCDQISELREIVNQCR